MSNPGSRSNDDKLLAKIKDLEAKVEDLKRHTHPDRSWGKPPAAGGVDALVRVRTSLLQPIATGSPTLFTWDDDYPVGAGAAWTYTGQSYVQVDAGVYLVAASIQWETFGGTATNLIRLEILREYTAPGYSSVDDQVGQWVYPNAGSAASETRTSAAGAYVCAAGDRLSVRVRHNAGINEAIENASFSVVRLGGA